jgi:CRISPR-associated protein Csd1
MSWFQRLYESYDNCVKASEGTECEILPMYHFSRKAHIEITINNLGNFIRAKLLEPSEKTIIPTTEDSASRTSGCAPHALADKIQYVAKDYTDLVGQKKSYFKEYFEQLKQWKNSQYSNPKINAIYTYVQKGTVIKDLVEFGIRLDELLTTQIHDRGDLLIRWRVNIKGDLQPETWNDENIRKSWIDFLISKDSSSRGMCYIESDKGEIAVTSKHPNRIYNGASGAKIISANDKGGFTYRGRFEEPNDAVCISVEVSQKAHAVLKFLLSKELNMAYQSGTQSYVAWSQTLEDLPKFYAGSDEYELFTKDENAEISGNISQEFAERLKKKMLGYSQKLGKANNIMVIGIDSATPGRISVVYYKELKNSDFLGRIESWHKKYSWLQDYGKDKKFYGVASPKDIAKAAYGNHADEKIIKKTVDRILPLIIENKKIPNSIVENCIRQASNPIIFSSETWRWRKILSIACALYKGNKYGEDYKMSLEKKSTDRNYLYGRLLAVIDYAEQIALCLANEKRETNARKYMNEFRNKPYLTWEKLHSMFNAGVRHRLKMNRTGFLNKIEKELKEILAKFDSKSYEDNSKLSGTYLLAYYCELNFLKSEGSTENDEENTENN